MQKVFCYNFNRNLNIINGFQPLETPSKES